MLPGVAADSICFDTPIASVARFVGPRCALAPKRRNRESWLRRPERDEVMLNRTRAARTERHVVLRGSAGIRAADQYIVGGSFAVQAVVRLLERIARWLVERRVVESEVDVGEVTLSPVSRVRVQPLVRRETATFDAVQSGPAGVRVVALRLLLRNRPSLASVAVANLPARTVGVGATCLAMTLNAPFVMSVVLTVVVAAAIWVTGR